LRCVKEEHVAEAILILGVTEEECASLDREAKMKRFENLAVYKFGIGRLVSLLNETEYRRLQEKILMFCDIEAGLEYLLASHIEKMGLFPFLRGILAFPNGSTMLREMCEMLGLPPKNLDNEMIKSIADEIMLSGSEELFSSFSEQLLHSFIIDLDLPYDQSAPKEKLVDYIMVHAFELEPLDSFQKLLQGESDSGSDNELPLKKRKHDDDEEKNATKPKKQKFVPHPFEEIKKGITQEQLRSYYNVTDLQEWCTSQELPTKGGKEGLIRMILEYLQTGEKPVKKEGKKKKKSKS